MRLLSYLIVATLFTTGCDTEKNNSAKRATRAHLVETVAVQRTPLKSKKIVTGSLVATRTVQIHNEEQGRITRIPVYPGDHVQKGDTILELNNTIFTAELDKATAAHKQARLDYKRIRKLKPRNLASEDELARAETAVEQTRAELALQQAKFDHSIVMAPFTGLISERLKEPGDIVPLHSHILTIYDPATLIAKINISEIILQSINVGHQVELRVDALGDVKINGTIIRIHPLINSSTRQGIVEIKLNNRPDGAYPGQLARVKIEGQTNPLPNLPLYAIRHDTRGEYVFRITKENKAQYTSIKTGIQLGERVEILAGLTEGDRVVSKGFLKLRDNSPVKINPAENALEPTENKSKN
mgnify:CR=1 FL=1